MDNEAWAGYVRFRRWRVYSNRALVHQAALAWLSEETLAVGTTAEPLAYYTVKVNRRGELTAVTAPRLLPARYQARQPRLWPWVPKRRRWSRPPRVHVDAVQGWSPTSSRRGEVSDGR